jgi:hypothetical protein
MAVAKFCTSYPEIDLATIAAMRDSSFVFGFKGVKGNNERYFGYFRYKGVTYYTKSAYTPEEAVWIRLCETNMLPDFEDQAKRLPGTTVKISREVLDPLLVESLKDPRTKYGFKGVKKVGNLYQGSFTHEGKLYRTATGSTPAHAAVERYRLTQTFPNYIEKIARIYGDVQVKLAEPIDYAILETLRDPSAEHGFASVRQMKGVKLKDRIRFVGTYSIKGDRCQTSQFLTPEEAAWALYLIKRDDPTYQEKKRVQAQIAELKTGRDVVRMIRLKATEIYGPMFTKRTNPIGLK